LPVVIPTVLLSRSPGRAEGRQKMRLSTSDPPCSTPLRTRRDKCHQPFCLLSRPPSRQLQGVPVPNAPCSPPAPPHLRPKPGSSGAEQRSVRPSHAGASGTTCTVRRAASALRPWEAPTVCVTRAWTYVLPPRP